MLLWLHETTPWLAMRTVLYLSTSSATSLPISGVPGVRYGARPTLTKTSYSGTMQVGGTMPATAKPVAYGGWQWQVATAVGCFCMICRCMRISLVRFLVPQSWLPEKSTRHMSSGLRRPLLKSVGVQMAMSSPTRMAMLPPLPSTYSRCQRRRPISQICSFKLCAYGELKNASNSDFGDFELGGRAGGASLPSAPLLALLKLPPPFELGAPPAGAPPFACRSKIKS